MKEAENYKEELLRHRHYFHMHPELGLEEKETSAYIKSYLENWGMKLPRFFLQE